MIKINLLPRTINEKLIIRNTALAFAVVLVAIVVGGLTYASSLSRQVSDKEAEAQQMEAWEARVQSIQKQAQDQLASVKPIKDKLDFINAVLKFNEEYPKLYAEVAKWTYEKVMYTAMACDGTQVVMSARTKNLDYLGRYLLNMYRATDFFTEVTISGVPGYGQSNQNNMMGGSLPGGGMFGGMPSGPAFDPGGAQSSLAGIGAISSSMQRTPSGEKWIDFAVICKLKTPIAAPSFAGAGGAAAAGGAPGAAPGGAPPGMPGPPMPGGPGPGMPGGPGMPMPSAGGMTPMPPAGG